MKRLFIYIKEIIITNVYKTIVLIIGVVLLSTALNIVDSKKLRKYKIVSEFNNGDDKYIIIKGGGREIGYDIRSVDYYIDEYHAIIADGYIKYEIATTRYVVLIILSISLLICGTFGSLLDGCRWDFVEIYNNVYILRDVIMDKDTEFIYYHYNGKLIRKIKIINGYTDKVHSYELVRIASNIRKSPNLYENFHGTKKQIRNNKISNIIDSSDENS